MEKELLYPITNDYRFDQSLDGMWDFKFDSRANGLVEGWQNGLPNSIKMPVPASFNDFFTDKDSREYTGDFWYSKRFFVPSMLENRTIAIRFGAATHRVVVYVNGIEIRQHEGGFLPFQADVTNAIRFGEENVVSLKLNNELSRETLPAGDTITLKNGKKMVKPFFDFYNYSGLNRSVHLVALPTQRITDFTAVTKLENGKAYVDYTVALLNQTDTKISVELADDTGKTVAKSEGDTGTLVVNQPVLWQVRDAHLYRMSIKLFKQDQEIDEYSDLIGLRTIEIKGHQILVNDKPVYLKGFGRHEDSIYAGRAYDRNVEKRDYELMKWMGANSFRTSHYPYDEEAYRFADREGFLIIDEVPAVGFKMAAASFLGGLDQSFFDGDWIEQLYEKHLDQIVDLIKRDKNHPSVLAWSLFNEPDTSTDSAVPYFKKIFNATANLDPEKRPRTFTLSEDDTFETSKCKQFPDFYLLNRYPGWYHKWGYEISEGEADLRQEMDQWQASDIEKPIVFSEYGADTEPGMHKLPSVMWSEEYQVELLEMFGRVFDDYDFIQGEQPWNLADFQTVEGNMRVNGNKKGLFTRDRQPKEAAFGLRQRWQNM
ncbi:beta-glucuronidase [Secundilactobacillus kimchicus]|uniref:Beta-glucuronidase n=1 Tax=Secundilactobacillus kimchicus JCM 15530 TaxID=1302272 RepID=A0A0R1HND1_9LACO|nr:beta-glucuronidase [Secundilactobacillus kimchicus]KRK48325.1 glycosyl hydrolase family 2, TIM barrel domain protein [Secundilactobacillus kimchicus JCM 15530]MBT9671091.1 beta-glucuronidase [Secundilactobacillus kimchicus]